MKYNVLNEFKEYLTETLAPSTALTYYKAVDYLLKEQVLIDLRKMNIDIVIAKLKAMRYKNQYSKYKNAFLKLCDYINLNFDEKTMMELEGMSFEKRKKRRDLTPIKLEDIKNRIRVIRDKKLKLSYQTMLITGLRVSELVQITKENGIIEDGSLTLHFIGKGGKREFVKLTDKKLLIGLQGLIANASANEHLFYSANYLQSEALKRGFKCVDLRRAFAMLSYKEHRNIKKVMKLMRHSKYENTKIYLNNRVKF